MQLSTVLCIAPAGATEAVGHLYLGFYPGLSHLNPQGMLNWVIVYFLRRPPARRVNISRWQNHYMSYL